MPLALEVLEARDAVGVSVRRLVAAGVVAFTRHLAAVVVDFTHRLAASIPAEELALSIRRFTASMDLLRMAVRVALVIYRVFTVSLHMLCICMG
jgi:hypothetical protein